MGGPGGSGRDGGDLTGFLEGSYPRGREPETRSQSSITQSTQIQFLHWYSFLYCLVMVIKNQIKFYPLFPSLFKSCQATAEQFLIQPNRPLFEDNQQILEIPRLEIHSPLLLKVFNYGDVSDFMNSPSPSFRAPREAEVGQSCTLARLNSVVLLG